MKNIYITIGEDSYIVKFSLRSFEGCTILTEYPPEALTEPWNCKILDDNLIYEPKTEIEE